MDMDNSICHLDDLQKQLQTSCKRRMSQSKVDDTYESSKQKQKLGKSQLDAFVIDHIDDQPITLKSEDDSYRRVYVSQVDQINSSLQTNSPLTLTDNTNVSTQSQNNIASQINWSSISDIESSIITGVKTMGIQVQKTEFPLISEEIYPTECYNGPFLVPSSSYKKLDDRSNYLSVNSSFIHDSCRCIKNNRRQRKIACRVSRLDGLSSLICQNHHYQINNLYGCQLNNNHHRRQLEISGHKNYDCDLDDPKLYGSHNDQINLQNNNNMNEIVTNESFLTANPVPPYYGEDYAGSEWGASSLWDASTTNAICENFSSIGTPLDGQSCFASEEDQDSQAGGSNFKENSINMHAMNQLDETNKLKTNQWETDGMQSNFIYSDMDEMDVIQLQNTQSLMDVNQSQNKQLFLNADYSFDGSHIEDGQQEDGKDLLEEDKDARIVKWLSAIRRLAPEEPLVS